MADINLTCVRVTETPNSQWLSWVLAWCDGGWLEAEERGEHYGAWVETCMQWLYISGVTGESDTLTVHDQHAW